LTFYEWLMKRRDPRYGPLKVAATVEPDFPRESNDMRALESAFCLAGIAGPELDAFRAGWIRYRLEEIRRKKHDK
jgi:uncharacterized protein YozE (UPF0346 family)